MDIKPIETQYNGYRFRSRLEARWAVFFDKLGIKYEYEPEGFVLPDGSCYLPDFYLPMEDMYVEVKPDRPGAADDLKKCIQFVDKSKRTLLLLGDISNVDNAECLPLWTYLLHYNTLTQKIVAAPIAIVAPRFIRNFYVSAKGDNIHAVDCKNIEGKASTILRCLTNEEINWDIVRHRKSGSRYIFDKPFPLPRELANQLLEAYTAARSARFEHGEKG